MSRTHKLTLLGLGIFALLFIALIVWGQRQHDCGQPGTSCQQGYEPGGGIKALGAVFAGAGPKVELPKKRYDSGAAGEMSIDIVPADDKTRRLRLKWVRGALQLKLSNVPVQGAPDLSGQDKFADLPRAADSSDDPADPDALLLQTFVVTSGGGSLTIRCVAPPCAVEAE